MAINILSVSQLNRFVKSLLNGAPQLAEVYLRGEISNLSLYQRSGHLYFTLKDQAAAVKAVMFAGNAAHLRFQPQNGMSVIARGSVTLYERDGSYQINVNDLQPDGAGALSVAFEQNKRRFAAEGLFDPERKRPIPRFPAVVGVATSPTGAAVRDMLSVLERRWPLAKVLFAPCAVQGRGAAESVAAALRLLNDDGRSDVILVGRGGGSAEDLWAFNEEPAVRAVSQSRIPVISAVGHETDFSLCDFAADLRAPTPSAAAELAVPDRAELWSRFSALQGQLGRRMAELLSGYDGRIRRAVSSPALQNPIRLVQAREERFRNANENFLCAMRSFLDRKTQYLIEQSRLLSSMNPLEVLGRGYSVTLTERGEPVRSSSQLAPGSRMTTVLAEGKLISVVESAEAP